MSEETWTFGEPYNDMDKASDPVLSGWSPGDVEVSLPFWFEGNDEANDLIKRQAAQSTRQGPNPTTVIEPLTEFPLYGKPSTRDRRYDQVKCAATLADDGTMFVLSTPDFKVVQSKSFWKVIWFYIKARYFTRKPKAKNKLKLPKYTY